MRWMHFLFFLGLLFACDLDKQQQKHADNRPQELPEQEADSVDVIYSEQGTIKFKLKAPKLLMKEAVNDSYNEFPEGLHMTFFDKTGEKNADLYANYGYDDQKERERYVRDSVKIITSKGEIFTTDELYIDEAKDSVHNNGNYVKITRPNGTVVQGKGFISDTRMERILIPQILPSTYVLENEETE